MADPKTVSDTVKAISEITKNIPIYQDAIQPVAIEVGKSLKTLGQTINIALVPLRAMVFGYELIAEKINLKLQERLSAIPSERIIIPPLAIVGPLIEKYKYVHDQEELSDLFMNLLSNAMDKESVEGVHPSFVQIMSELTCEEAKLIKVIAEEKLLPKLDLASTEVRDGIQQEGHIDIYNNFTLLGEKASIINSEFTNHYLDNLERLGIIRLSPPGTSYVNKEAYAQLRNHPFTLMLKKKVEDKGNRFIAEEGIIFITDFGDSFIKVALKKIIKT